MTRSPGLLLFCAAMLGCTTEPAGDGGTQSDTPCEDIVSACHYKDDGTPGPLNDCHQVGHDENADACAAQLDMCLQICNDADPIDDTDGHDEHGEHGEHGEESTTADDDTTSTGDPPATDSGDSTTTNGEGGTSSSTGNDSTADANCSDLGSGCHDVPGKVAAMCHDVGHDGDEEACAEIWVECREACGF